MQLAYSWDLTLSAGTQYASSSLYTKIPTTLGWPAGNLYLIFMVDADEVVTETNEQNNINITGPIAYSPVIVGIDLEGSKELLLKIYPNPTSDFLHVEGSEVLNVKIMDINDQIILQTATNPIDVASLRSGLYSIHITTPEGQFTRRLVKK